MLGSSQPSPASRGLVIRPARYIAHPRARLALWSGPAEAAPLWAVPAAPAAPGRAPEPERWLSRAPAGEQRAACASHRAAGGSAQEERRSPGVAAGPQAARRKGAARGSLFPGNDTLPHPSDPPLCASLSPRDQSLLCSGNTIPRGLWMLLLLIIQHPACPGRVARLGEGANPSSRTLLLMPGSRGPTRAGASITHPLGCSLLARS